MRLSFTQYQKFPRWLAPLLLTVYLSSCGGNPQSTEPIIDRPSSTPNAADTEIPTLPQSKFHPQFQRAEQLLLIFDWMAASTTLKEVAVTEASPEELQYLQYLQARILYLSGQQYEAMGRTGDLARQVTDPAMANKVNNFLRYMLSAAGKHLSSARIADNQLRQTQVDPTTADALLSSIWRDLQRASVDELQQALTQTNDPRWSAWLRLALLTASTESTEQLGQGLARWQAENPGHPVAHRLPGGLTYLQQPTGSLQKVALILPLSDRLATAAKAVRDGYMANYYAARSEGGAHYELQIVDLDRYNSVVNAYNDAVAAGANLVIGPLSKSDVAQLGAYMDRPVPILALNRIDTQLPAAQTALIQFALAPEDEAGQIANLAFGRGARVAVVIRPQGHWGDKMENALLEQWSKLGGRLGAVARYSSQEDYSSSMAGSLNLPQSEQRAKDVRSMLAANIEFTARRRQDIDVIFLLSRSGAEARSLKPLLAYHYAGDLPVYATSSIYRGVPDPADKDLNGVLLVETPWLLGAAPSLHLALSEGKKPQRDYTRLNALGADAFLLQSRFAQLQAGPEVHIRGHTGLLGLDPQLRITRELQPATFDGGDLSSP